MIRLEEESVSSRRKGSNQAVLFWFKTPGRPTRVNTFADPTTPSRPTSTFTFSMVSFSLSLVTRTLYCCNTCSTYQRVTVADLKGKVGQRRDEDQVNRRRNGQLEWVETRVIDVFRLFISSNFLVIDWLRNRQHARYVLLLLVKPRERIQILIKLGGAN